MDAAAMNGERKGQGFLRLVMPVAVLAGFAGASMLGGWAGMALAGTASAVVLVVFHVLLRDSCKVRAGYDELTDQLIQSQKMAAMGELAAGIAHEINTPLMIIGQESEIMEEYLEHGLDRDEAANELAQGLARIRRQVERCGDITHKMLGLARKSDTVEQETDLSALVEDMVLLLEKEVASRGVRIRRSYAKHMPKVPVDQPLLRQVVLNLLNNAAQALDQGGTITVSIRLDGRQVLLEVADDGPGIPPNDLDKIFNPFFTTKPPGSGTGLGLSICLGIVNRLGGTILVSNAPSGGAVFTVRLPRSGRGHNAAKAA